MLMVVIEGIDGAGKTSQAKSLAKYLGGRYLKFPDRETPCGKVIDAMLKGQFKIDGGILRTPEETRQAQAVVMQALQFTNRFERSDDLNCNSTPLVCDRYWQSGYAYGGNDGLSDAWLLGLHQSLRKADFNIFIDVPVEVALRRIQARGGGVEAYEKVETLKRVRDRYINLWMKNTTSSLHNQWFIVDGEHPIKTLEMDILGRLANR